MAVSGTFELSITTNTQEEMDKIAEAIYSGLAESCIKDRVLWGGMAPVYSGRNVEQNVSMTGSSAPEVELQRLETKAKSKTASPAPAKKERVVSVMGRGRMGRT